MLSFFRSLMFAIWKDWKSTTLMCLNQRCNARIGSSRWYSGLALGIERSEGADEGVIVV
jgi:hypothetical protein